MLKRIDLEHLNTGGAQGKARASYLPKLFQNLVRRLRQGTCAIESVGAAAHGLLRFKQGYPLATLVEESRLLQVSIFHTLHLNAHRIDFSLLLPDVMVIVDEVDSRLAQAARSYTSGAKTDR